MKIKMRYFGVDYELIPCECFFKSFLEVDIKEVVKPDRKYFRTKLVDRRAFLIKNYATIEDGCKAVLKKYVEEKNFNNELKKWLKKS